MPQFDLTHLPGQVFWVLTIFAALYCIMAFVALPRLAQIIDDREDRINNDLNKARELQKEAEFVEIEYRKVEAEAKAKAKAIIDEIKAEIEVDILKHQQALAAEMEQDISKANQRIKSAADNAMAELETVVHVLAGRVVEQLSGHPVDERLLRKTVQDCLSQQPRHDEDKHHAA